MRNKLVSSSLYKLTDASSSRVIRDDLMPERGVRSKLPTLKRPQEESKKTSKPVEIVNANSNVIIGSQGQTSENQQFASNIANPLSGFQTSEQSFAIDDSGAIQVSSSLVLTTQMQIPPQQPQPQPQPQPPQQPQQSQQSQTQPQSPQMLPLQTVMVTSHLHQPLQRPQAPSIIDQLANCCCCMAFCPPPEQQNPDSNRRPNNSCKDVICECMMCFRDCAMILDRL